MTTSTTTADELEERVRNGDTTITAKTIAAARAGEEHALLLAEADRRAAGQAAEAEHAAAVAQLRTDIAAVEDTTDAQRSYASAAVAALNDLVDALQARADTVRELGARARALGIAELDGQFGTSGDAGIGWSFDRTARAVTRLRIDDRLLGTVNPRHIVNKVLAEFLAGRRLDTTSFEPYDSLAALIDGQDRTVTAPQQARVRLLVRHGHRPAGAVHFYDSVTAAWLIAKSMAEAA